MDATITSEHGIPPQPLSVPMDARALDGRSVLEVTHSTVPVQLWVSGNHSETIHFLLIASPHVPVVLGISWLQKQNHVIDWTQAPSWIGVLFAIPTAFKQHSLPQVILLRMLARLWMSLLFLLITMTSWKCSVRHVLLPFPSPAPSL